MPYQFATGFDNVAGLTALSVPEFASSPMRPGRLRAAGNRHNIADGDMIQEWEFSAISHAEFTSLCADMGFDADDYAPASVEATVSTKKNDGRGFANYNAVVSLDERVYDLSFNGPENVVFHVQIVGAPS